MLLSLTYEETKALWRPMEEFKQGLVYLVAVVTAPAWLVGTVVEGAAAGLLVGLRVREAKPKVAGA